MNDVTDLFRGFIQIIIDHDIFIEIFFRQLVFSLFESACDLFFRLGASVADALFKIFKCGGNQKDRAGVRYFFHNLFSTLDLDFEQNVFALVQMFFDRFGRRAIAVAGELGVFEKTVFINGLLKLFRTDKEICNAFLIFRAGSACGHGNGIDRIELVHIKQFANRSFSNSARPGQDDDFTFFQNLTPLAANLPLGYSSADHFYKTNCRKSSTVIDRQF